MNIKVFLKRGYETSINEGFIQLLKKSIVFIWKNTMRKYMTKSGYVFKNGVRVSERRAMDRLFGIRPDDPNKEAELVHQIREYVGENESVVVIGAAWGVSTVVAAKQIGSSGEVKTFEAGSIDRITESVYLNDVSDIVEINKAIIGPSYAIRGNSSDSMELSVDELPECDTLVIDCDGCEIEVLENMVSYPMRIIIEHHSKNGFEYQEEQVKKLLRDNGYEIVDEHKRDAEFLCIVSMRD